MKSGSTGDKDWQFDENIAAVFVEHARKHIPNYEGVIDKCVSYCDMNLHKQSRIIDVGCATGHTLEKLHSRGFTDLHGVDNSKHMIDLAPKHVATYHVSDRLPPAEYDMVLCNWTLHFIKDKKKYLRSICDNLRVGGTLILSEKTSKDPEMIRMYHAGKKRMGVPDDEIKKKQAQLQNVMFIQSVEWYQSTLESMGFTASVIDADWCFTTLLCRKEQWIQGTYLTGW